MDKFLQQLADRLQIPDSEIITADEVNDWPTGKLDELLKAGLLTEIQHSKGVICSECEEKCFIEPDLRKNPDTRESIGIFTCTRNPDVGRIEVDLNRLKQWKVDSTKLAKLGYGTEQNNHHSEIPYEIGLLEEIAETGNKDEPDEPLSWMSDPLVLKELPGSVEQWVGPFDPILRFHEDTENLTGLLTLKDCITHLKKILPYWIEYQFVSPKSDILADMTHTLRCWLAKVRHDSNQKLPPIPPDLIGMMDWIPDVEKILAGGTTLKETDYTAQEQRSKHIKEPARTRQKDKSVKELSKEAKNVFKKSGDFWLVAYQGNDTKTIKNSKGMFYTKRLLEKPEESISAIELANTSFDFESLNRGNCAEYESVDTDVIKPQELVDHDYLEQCQKRLRDIKTELAEAQKNSDLAILKRLDKEKNQILSLLKTDTFRGKSTKFSDDMEKARKAVAKAITMALKNIKKHNTSLYQHLKISIQLGSYCTYTPDKKIHWEL